MARPTKKGFGRGQVYIPIDTLTAPIWNRQPAETEKQWAAFLHFREAGEDRSLEESAKALGYAQNRHGKYTNGWFSGNNIVWRWRERAQAYDDYKQERIDKAKLRASEKVAAKFAARDEQRRQASIEGMYQLGQKLAQKSSEMLDMPLYQVRIEAGDDGITHIYEPARGTGPGVAAQMADKASNLIVAALTASSKPVEDYTPAELHAIADAMTSQEEIKAELAAMDAEDDRRRILAIEDMVVVDDDDDGSDDVDESDD